MADIENKNESQTVPETDANQDYINALKEMKENSVSKQAYMKLQQENKQLLDSLVNGKEIENKPQKETVDIDKLRQNLFGSKRQDMSNLEYVSNSLKLRNALMDRGELDPFVPQGKKIHPTDDDFKKAEKVAQILQECVDYADGDAMVFTDELKRKII